MALKKLQKNPNKINVLKNRFFVPLSGRGPVEALTPTFSGHRVRWNNEFGTADRKQSMRTYTTKTVTLPDDHWEVLEHEAFLAVMPVDKLLAHAVRLMQLDAVHARRGLSREYVNDKGEIQREEPIGLPELD